MIATLTRWADTIRGAIGLTCQPKADELRAVEKEMRAEIERQRAGETK